MENEIFVNKFNEHTEAINKLSDRIKDKIDTGDFKELIDSRPARDAAWDQTKIDMKTEKQELINKLKCN